MMYRVARTMAAQGMTMTKGFFNLRHIAVGPPSLVADHGVGRTSTPFTSGIVSPLPSPSRRRPSRPAPERRYASSPLLCADASGGGIQTVTSQLSSSAHGVAAIHWEGVADHEAGGGTAQPQNRIGDLLGTAKAPHRHFLHQSSHGVRLGFQHARDHRRRDDAGAHRIDADTLGGIFQPGALGQPNHAMLGGVIDAPFGNTDEPAERRVVHDG